MPNFVCVLMKRNEAIVVSLIQTYTRAASMCRVNNTDKSSRRVYTQHV